MPMCRGKECGRREAARGASRGLAAPPAAGGESPTSVLPRRGSSYRSWGQVQRFRSDAASRDESEHFSGILSTGRGRGCTPSPPEPRGECWGPRFITGRGSKDVAETRVAAQRLAWHRPLPIAAPFLPACRGDRASSGLPAGSPPAVKPGASGGSGAEA